MADKRKRLGKEGEDRAEEFLKKNGYRIIQRNYNTPYGEVDIIGINDNCLCFVEVRTRSSDWHGHPFESITRVKMQRIIKAAMGYIEENNLDQMQSRFDVVSVIPNINNSYDIEIIKNAFELA